MLSLIGIETDARRAYAIEECLKEVYKESDYRKPKNAGKDWVGKADWEMLHRIDPTYAKSLLGGDLLKDMRAEIRKAVLDDAEFARVKAKAQESGGQAFGASIAI